MPISVPALQGTQTSNQLTMNSLSPQNLLLTFLICSVTGLFAQVSFTDSTSMLSVSPESFYPAGVADMNLDGLDDVVICDNGRNIYIEYQQPDGSFVNSGQLTAYTSAQWGWAIADVDGNGHRDIISGGAYNNVRMLKADDAAGSSFSQSLLPGPGLFVQCTNFADIDNNGVADYFACHDDAESRIWENDGSGNFTQADSWIDMTTTPASDNSGNYGSTWVDVDRDGDLDLYISKCRGGVGSSSDPRRVNQLFINDGAGGWTEEAAARGVADGEQTWASDFADLDNDGDFDLIMTNHTGDDLVVYKNIGSGFFTEITSATDISVSGTGLQVKCADFNNDGFIDILNAGLDQALWLNDGDLTFTEAVGAIPRLTTMAVGDLNNDGFSDIYADLNGAPDKIYLNDANSNHYINFRLTGVASNADAIGALVEIYGAWGLQIREVRAGESYGIANTFVNMFGIGTATSCDSARIIWPSGTVDLVIAPGIDQTHDIVEGSTSCNASSVVQNISSTPGTTTVMLNWTALPGADAYQLSGRVAGMVSFKNRFTNNNFFNVSGLNSSTAYEWMIRARCQATGLPTAFSALQSFTTSAPRLAQQDLKIWPLPASERIYLSMGDAPHGDYPIEITRIDGAAVLRTQIAWNGAPVAVEIPDHLSGNYLISFGDELPITKKLFIE